MPTEHLTTKVLARGAHIHSMHAHVCQLAPAQATHLPCPLPCRELQSFTSAVVIRDAVCRCLLDHYFHQLFRRFKAPGASQGTTNPRLLPPSRATAAFTARSGQRVATTHRDEVLRQAGSTPSPTTAPSDIHRLPPRVSDRPMRRPWASGRFWPRSDNQVVLFSGGALRRGGLAVASLAVDEQTMSGAAAALR